MLTETQIVRRIERDLKRCGRFYVNIHGSVFSRNGTPDILTMSDGVFTALEVKRPGNYPSIVQVRRGLEIVESGGRFVVAYDDFDLELVDGRRVPTIDASGLDELMLFEKLSNMSMFSETVEVVDGWF